MNAPILPVDPEVAARIEAKRREAIQQLGNRYLLHPENRVPRKTPEQRVLS